MLNGKIAIVTGAASGIGYAVAESLSRDGAKVVMADVNQALLAEAAANITGSAIPIDGGWTAG